MEKLRRYESVFIEGKKPKFWDSGFAAIVISDYKKGELTLDNIKQWDKKQNGGKDPKPAFNTEEILNYHIDTKKDAGQ